MECPVKLEVNIAKLYVEGCGGVIEMRLVGNTHDVLRDITVSVCFRHVTNYGKHAIPTLEPGRPSHTLQTQMDLPRNCRGNYVIGFGVSVGRADASESWVGEAAILVQPWDEPPRSMVQVNGEKAAMGAYIHVNVKEAIEAGKIPTLFELLGKASIQPKDWRAVILRAREGRTPELPRRDAMEQERRAQELLVLLVKRVKEGNPTVISYTQGYEYLFGPIHRGHPEQDVPPLLRVARRCSPVELPALGDVLLDTFLVNKRTRWPGSGHWRDVAYDKEAWGRVFGSQFLQQDEFP